MNKIKLYIHELEYAIKFLYGLELYDYDSRMRTRFLKVLTERFEQYNDEYAQLIKEHSNLDESGAPLIIIEGQVQRYDIKDIELFMAALIPLHEEEFVIEIHDNNRNMVKSVAKSILNCGLKFKGKEQYQYSSLAEKFEDIDFEA